jgi:Tfp pilus assembly protein FimT
MMEMLLVLAIGFIIAGFSIVTYLRMQRNLRSAGDARDIHGEISLAKMRAAAYFTQARFFADLDDRMFRIEVWDKNNNTWTEEGGRVVLSSGVNFGYGGLSTPPAGTQASIGQAPQCRDSSGASISGTACVVFNSRGIPVDSSGAPTALDAIYLTDGGSIYGITVTATGLIQTWRSDSNAAHWAKR